MRRSVRMLLVQCTQPQKKWSCHPGGSARTQMHDYLVRAHACALVHHALMNADGELADGNGGHQHWSGAERAGARF